MIRDRAIGALLGLAVGDAVGTTLEFSRRDSRSPLTDMVGGGPFGLKPGDWTDDTSMALCLADSLLAQDGLDPNDLMQRFVRWQREGENSVNGRCFDIGITTSQALGRFRRSGDPKAGDPSPQAAGNGSLMRLAPVAIFHADDPAQARQAAIDQSETTHRAPAALDACAAFAELLVAAIGGADRDRVLSIGPAVGDPSIAAIMAGSWRAKERNQIESSGYVVHTLEAALWCIGRAENFREAILVAANLGDDADTVAAVTGQLAGALWGAVGIPIEWRQRLAWRERIDELANRLFDQTLRRAA